MRMHVRFICCWAGWNGRESSREMGNKRKLKKKTINYVLICFGCCASDEATAQLRSLHSDLRPIKVVNGSLNETKSLSMRLVQPIESDLMWLRPQRCGCWWWIDEKFEQHNCYIVTHNEHTEWTAIRLSAKRRLLRIGTRHAEASLNRFNWSETRPWRLSHHFRTRRTFRSH